MPSPGAGSQKQSHLNRYFRRQLPKTGAWMLGRKIKQMSAIETQIQLPPPPPGASGRRAFLPAFSASSTRCLLRVSLCPPPSSSAFPQFSVQQDPISASRTFTASICPSVQPFAFGVFSKAEERDSCGNLASSPKLKGSSYRILEMPQP